MSTREQITQAASELRKLIDRIESVALDSLDAPSMERLAAFDVHRSSIDSTLMVLRRAVVRRAEREQSRTEPDDGETSAESTAPHEIIPTNRPTTRPTK